MFRTLVKRARLTQPKKFFSEFEGTRLDCTVEGMGKEVVHEEPAMLLVHGGNIFGLGLCFYYIFHLCTKKDTRWSIWQKERPIDDNEQIQILPTSIDYKALEKNKIRQAVRDVKL